MDQISGDAATPHGIRSFVDVHQWNAVRRLGSGASFRQGQTVLSQGEEGTTVVLFLSGRSKVTYTAPDGSHALLSIRGPGDVVGEVAPPANEVRMATVSALEPVVARVIPFGEFMDEVNKFGRGQEWRRYWADRFRDAGQCIWRIPGQPPERRMAALFMAMLQAGGGVLSVPMKQEELAASLGLSRRRVWTFLDRWRAAGWVTIARSRVDIKDPGAIRSLLPDGM